MVVLAVACQGHHGLARMSLRSCFVLAQAGNLQAYQFWARC